MSQGAESPDVGRSPRYPIESVANAGRVLEMFSTARELRISDVANVVGVSLSTAHRLLTTHEAIDFVRQNATTRCYEPGPALVDLASAMVPRESRWSFARPYLAALSERVGETVNLMLLQGTEVSFVESVESTSSVRVGSRLGAIMAAHSTSGGKILLAALPKEAVLDLYPDAQIEHPLGGKDVQRKDLLAEMRRSAKRGYATNFGESEAGISGVAVRVVAGSLPDFALAVSVPSGRVSAARVGELVEELRATAEAISSAAGA